MRKGEKEKGRKSDSLTFLQFLSFDFAA